MPTERWTRSYDAYITSRLWRDRRARYFRKHKKCCAACGSTTDIHLHHHTYARLGHEADEDLVPLCQYHHNGVHEIHQKMKQRRRNYTLTQATEAIVGTLETYRSAAPERKSKRHKRISKAKQKARQRAMKPIVQDYDPVKDKPVGRRDHVNAALAQIRERRRAAVPGMQPRPVPHGNHNRSPRSTADQRASDTPDS